MSGDSDVTPPYSFSRKIYILSDVALKRELAKKTRARP